MIGFLLKKTFFDFWDNFVSIILMNIAAVFLVVGFFLLPSVAGLPSAYLPFYVVPGIIALNFFFSAVCRYTLDLADYKKSGLPAFFRYLRDCWKQSLVTSVITLAMLGFVLFVLPVSLFSNSIIFLAAGGLAFWIWVTVYLSVLFFLPASIRLKKTLFQSLRFAFSFVFDNTAFSFFLLLFSIVILALSIFLVFLVPGIAAIALFLNVGFKLRIYKYYWLESHPGADRKKIPWNELIAEDYERVGKRTVRGMIFPWK
jgi:hypothetical protein